MHRSAGAASRRWWDATRRAEARATASSADIVGARRAVTRLLGRREPSELFVGYFGWRSARRNSAQSARALPAAGVPQSGAPPSATTMRRSPTPLPPNLPRCESALLALPRERKGGYRADTDIAVPSPFEEMARLARRLDVLGGDEEDATTTDHSHHRRDIDDDLANAWTVARRLAEGRAELRPALTLLAQCMEQRARAVRRRMDARARCAGALLARVMEVRATADRVERALEDTGLLTPARRACGIDDASPEKTHPSSQHVHACATFDEEVRAINEGRRRPSALPAPLGITPPVTASDPNNKRARRDDDDDDETERRRKQRREFSFDLVTPTLSTTPDEGDEEEMKKNATKLRSRSRCPRLKTRKTRTIPPRYLTRTTKRRRRSRRRRTKCSGAMRTSREGTMRIANSRGKFWSTTDCQKLLRRRERRRGQRVLRRGRALPLRHRVALGVREARGRHAVAVTNHEVTTNSNTN